MNEFYSINKINKTDKNETKDIHDYSKLSSDDNARVKILRIPPNWTSVKLSKDPSSKIQATGLDARGRKQYIYHPVWTLFSKDTKYTKVNSINFDKFNSIINKLSKQKISDNFTKNYVIANMFILMRDLNIRVGNEKYLEENDSVGLCTLQKIHYKKEKEDKSNNSNSSNTIHKFIFIGKKAVQQEKILQKPHITFIENIIKIPGNSLFKYSSNEETNESNKSNSYRKICSEDLNNFLKENVDKNMSCKDIRTYCANEIFKKEYSRLLNDGIDAKKARIEATKKTAKELGNTPKVCRDSYIDPSLYLE